MTNDLFRGCPVCGATEGRAELAKEEFRLVRCRPCGMVYANPVAASMASGLYYEKAADYYLSPEKLAGDYAPVRFEREIRAFQRYCPRGKVLDVGCSTGGFLFNLQARFGGRYDVLGTDVSGPPLDYAASRGIPVLREPFLEHNFGSTRFDAICFWAVIEHLLDPRAFLRKAAQILSDNGCCFVLVPNYHSLAQRVLKAKYRYVYPQHLNYFTVATLKQLLEEYFEVQAISTTHFNPLVLWQDWKGGGGEVSNEQRGKLLKRTTAMKTSPWLWPLKAGYRVAEGGLARAGLADNLLACGRVRSRPASQ